MPDNNKLDYIQERLDTVVDRIADLSKTVEAQKTNIEQYDGLKDELCRMSSTLNDNTLSLREHMRRTDLLEEYLKNLDKRFTPIEMDRLRKKAVNSWVSVKLKFIVKLSAAVSALGALGVAAKHILERLG